MVPAYTLAVLKSMIFTAAHTTVRSAWKKISSERTAARAPGLSSCGRQDRYLMSGSPGRPIIQAIPR